MQNRHCHRDIYFREQSRTTEKYIIPYIHAFLPIHPDLMVAEIGCGEGGNLKPFLDRGCRAAGIDLSENKISNAGRFFSHHPNKNRLTLIARDIYRTSPDELPPADLILIRDTLEHIPDQARFLKHLRQFIKPSGKIFISFPPLRMPFGGHQQMCENAFLSRLPFFHLLPDSLYAGILRRFGEKNTKIEALLEIKRTGLSIGKFKSMVRESRYRIENEIHYLINPNYEVKFRLKPRKLPRIFRVPFFSDLITTTYYCILSL